VQSRAGVGKDTTAKALAEPTGLPGNDAADEAAVKTAKQETPVDAHT
jgi:hypothetical protein